MSKNIFVLGLDEVNLVPLQHLPDAQDYRFHPLLSVPELQGTEIDLPALLAKATSQLEAFEDRIDAIVGYWDFPVSSLVPMLCARYGLRSADLAAVVKCEHKYWSRLEQAKVIDEYPPFALIDLDHDSSVPEGLRYPVWIKPVKSFSSELAFKARDDDEFTQAVKEIREGIHRIGDPFDWVLRHVDLPAEIAEIGGAGCLAEQEVTGAQVTVEGYNFDGDIHVYGVVDSIPYAGSSSFLRYQYPSVLPADMTERLKDISRRVIGQIGLESVAFNIEYFVDPVREKIALLEVNPRHSQSHARLFEWVDGTPNHQCMIRLALGLEPQLPHRAGPYNCAAKWYLRRFTDAVVRRVPTEEEIARVESHVPGSAVWPAIGEGERLSETAAQDSYSYEIAHLFIGADSEQELLEKYEQCLAGLDFEFDDEE